MFVNDLEMIRDAIRPYANAFLEIILKKIVNVYYKMVKIYFYSSTNIFNNEMAWDETLYDSCPVDEYRIEDTKRVWPPIYILINQIIKSNEIYEIIDFFSYFVLIFILTLCYFHIILDLALLTNEKIFEHASYFMFSKLKLRSPYSSTMITRAKFENIILNRFDVLFTIRVFFSYIQPSLPAPLAVFVLVVSANIFQNSALVNCLEINTIMSKSTRPAAI